MSIPVFGKVCNLAIAGGQGEKHFYGDVAVGDTHKIQPNWPTSLCIEWIEGFVHIFSEGSEECYSHLMISAEEGEIQQLLKSFSEFTNLTVVRRYKEDLHITVMLNRAEFSWFSKFIEAHYFNSLEYLLHLPIVGFARDSAIEAGSPPKHMTYVPTAESFLTGRPFFIPNKSISLVFRHLTEDEAHKYKWIEDHREIEERKQRAGAEARAMGDRREARNRELDQVLADADARRNALRTPKWKTAIWWGIYAGMILLLVAVYALWQPQ
jgi:hypothetical protein